MVLPFSPPTCGTQILIRLRQVLPGTFLIKVKGGLSFRLRLRTNALRSLAASFEALAFETGEVLQRSHVRRTRTVPSEPGCADPALCGSVNLQWKIRNPPDELELERQCRAIRNGGTVRPGWLFKRDQSPGSVTRRDCFCVNFHDQYLDGRLPLAGKANPLADELALRDGVERTGTVGRFVGVNMPGVPRTYVESASVLNRVRKAQLSRLFVTFCSALR